MYFLLEKVNFYCHLSLLEGNPPHNWGALFAGRSNLSQKFGLTQLGFSPDWSWNIFGPTFVLFEGRVNILKWVLRLNPPPKDQFTNQNEQVFVKFWVQYQHQLVGWSLLYKGWKGLVSVSTTEISFPSYQPSTASELAFNMSEKLWSSLFCRGECTYCQKLPQKKQSNM